ncbi:winged helix-turn-helix domain-containing protein [Sulfobacillus harzensis]|uniref:Helix-turn-helix domain-containing protein n=1 Tax=Sulfobacillus harzensis TaxID=2729629 RepID=A0A7Y0L6J0_9FIRM|nr:winged helix-turn-helix domain-containing protein [Sulfobacillus harzensis]NMP24156.1 helix-turn-helix domain-containing protein [Sulfobacillus harzensis]
MPGSPPLPPESQRLRALGHPTRIALLQHLASSGPATATECAKYVGASPSSCSWHLRALAKAGWVEALDQRHGRERPWKYVGDPDHVLPSNPHDPVTVAVETALRGQSRAVEDWFRRNRHRFPANIAEMGEFIDAVLWLTPDEVKTLRQAVQDIMASYGRYDPRSRPANAVRVVSSWSAVPWIATEEDSHD